MRDINYSMLTYRQNVPCSEEEATFLYPQEEGVSEPDLAKIDRFSELKRADRRLMLDIVGEMLREEIQELVKK